METNMIIRLLTFAMYVFSFFTLVGAGGLPTSNSGGTSSSSGSSSNRSYGEFPDAVLLKETKKVWDLIEDITGALNQQEQ